MGPPVPHRASRASMASGNDSQGARGALGVAGSSMDSDCEAARRAPIQEDVAIPGALASKMSIEIQSEHAPTVMYIMDLLNRGVSLIVPALRSKPRMRDARRLAA